LSENGLNFHTKVRAVEAAGIDQLMDAVVLFVVFEGAGYSHERMLFRKKVH
jgi:hypothetical protein